MPSDNKRFCDCLTKIDESRVDNKYAICTSAIYNKHGKVRPKNAIKNCEKYKPYAKKKCPSGKVLNPKTGRCINKDGALAKKLGL